MNTKASLFGLVTLFAALAFPSTSRAADTLYTCSMHPQILKLEPGTCPICGMDLVPVNAGTGMASPVIEIHPGTMQLMNLKTDEVTRGPVNRLVRAVGEIAYNERGLRDITTKYEGWIERLHVDATWTTVKAGDPLFDIYSPDLYNAELNYLVALRTENGSEGPLTRSSLARLRLFDVPENFITRLAESREASRTYTFRAPFDGIVIEKNGVEGQMVKPGERVFRLADLSTVWINAQLYEGDLGVIAVGQDSEVRVTYGGDRRYHGHVDQVLPLVQADTRTAMARVVVENPDGFLRPGMYADIRFTSAVTDDAVLVPDAAVLRSGERNTVFVSLGDGRFEPRTITLGARTDDYRYQVIEGLTAGDRVVTSGQFMLDSESQLREAIQKMNPTGEAGAAAVPAEHQH